MQRTAVSMFLVLEVGVAACGGGATATTAPGGGAASGPPSATEPAQASVPAATDAGGVPTAPTVPSVDPGGGGTTTDVCGLVTVAEMESVFGISGVTQQLFAGPPDTCDFRRDEAAFVAMVLIPTGGIASFSAYAYEQGAEPISGLGDEALYSPSTQLVIIRKGDAVVSIAVFDSSLDDATRLERLKAVGTIAAGRM